jgi:hypothetical protein
VFNAQFIADGAMPVSTATGDIVTVTASEGCDVVTPRPASSAEPALRPAPRRPVDLDLKPVAFEENSVLIPAR